MSALPAWLAESRALAALPPSALPEGLHPAKHDDVRTFDGKAKHIVAVVFGSGLNTAQHQESGPAVVQERPKPRAFRPGCYRQQAPVSALTPHKKP